MMALQADIDAGLVLDTPQGLYGAKRPPVAFPVVLIACPSAELSLLSLCYSEAAISYAAQRRAVEAEVSAARSLAMHAEQQACLTAPPLNEEAPDAPLMIADDNGKAFVRLSHAPCVRHAYLTATDLVLLAKSNAHWAENAATVRQSKASWQFFTERSRYLWAEAHELAPDMVQAEASKDIAAATTIPAERTVH